MSQGYEKEKAELENENDALEAEIADASTDTDGACRFIALIEKYENFDELTNAMLLELVDKVLVHERDKKYSQECMQEIEIYFNFVGKFIPPDFENKLTEEEIAEQRKIAEFKERQHQAYLSRKESGWQKKYEEKIKVQRKAKITKLNDEIRKEDIERESLSRWQTCRSLHRRKPPVSNKSMEKSYNICYNTVTKESEWRSYGQENGCPK